MAAARSRTLASAYLVLGLLATGAYFLLPAGVARAGVFEAVAVSALVAVLVGVRRFAPTERRIWYLLAAGVAAFVLGELTWDVYLLRLGEDPFPSVADLFYLAGYPLIAAALVLLVRGRSGGVAVARATLIDAAIVTGSAGLLVWVFLIEPYTGDAALSTAEEALSAAYPLMDLLLLGVLVRLVFTPGRRSRSFWLLVAAVAANITADTAFSVLELRGGFATGTWVDAAWLLGYVAFGAAALEPSMARIADFAPRSEATLTRLRLAALAAAALVPPVVVAVQVALGEPAAVLAFVVGATLLPLLALARLAGLVREVERLAADRERLLASERAARAEAETTQRLLAEQNDRLRELDRLKDEFVALVSHELRTPLTSVTGYLELLRHGAHELTDEHRRFLEVADRNSRRLVHLVGDLLFIAQVDAGKLALERHEVDLTAVASDCVEGLRPRADEKEIAMTLTADGPARLSADRARIAQLLDNLVSNAVKFTPRGGSVSISIACEDGHASVEVADTGVGIPAEEQRRLFERFFRASTARVAGADGTGLGLTIAKAIVDAHGGRLSVESTKGVGTTVRVSLPLAHAGQGNARLFSRTAR